MEQLDPEIPEPLTTAELLKAALEDAHELVVLEVALAKEELGKTAKSILGAALAALSAAALSVISLTMLVVALLLAIGASPAMSLFGSALVLLSIAAVGLFVGYRVVPKYLLGNTRARVERNLRQLRHRTV